MVRVRGGVCGRGDRENVEIKNVDEVSVYMRGSMHACVCNVKRRWWGLLSFKTVLSLLSLVSTLGGVVCWGLESSNTPAHSRG